MEGGCLVSKLALCSIRRKKKSMCFSLGILGFEFCAEVKAKRGTIEQCSAEASGLAKRRN